MQIKKFTLKMLKIGQEHSIFLSAVFLARRDVSDDEYIKTNCYNLHQMSQSPNHQNVLILINLIANSFLFTLLAVKSTLQPNSK